MILAIDKHNALHIFVCTEEAERHLEAIDVQQDTFEFCDDHGQLYSVVYARPPTESRLGPFRTVDIGAFKLIAEGAVDSSLPEKFVVRADHIEHSSLSCIATRDELRDALRKQA